MVGKGGGERAARLLQSQPLAKPSPSSCRRRRDGDGVGTGGGWGSGWGDGWWMAGGHLGDGWREGRQLGNMLGDNEGRGWGGGQRGTIECKLWDSVWGQLGYIRGADKGNDLAVEV